MSRATAIESFNLKISILAASAYVSLCLGDYILSLEHAKTLLSFNKLPGAYKMLAKYLIVYCNLVSYAKFTHLKNTSSWYIPCQQLKPTFLATHITVMMQPSRYSIFYDRDTSI